MAYDTPLESFRQELQVYFRPRSNRRFERKVIATQSCKSPKPGSFGTHINAPAEFNQDTLESAHECRNRLQRERHAKQCIKLAMPLHLFGDEDALASARWDCGEMDIIYGFCNAKMWIKERLAKLSNSNPQFSLCCENGKVLLPSLPTTLQELEVLLTSKKRSAIKF